jgi:hypothetical protein
MLRALFGVLTTPLALQVAAIKVEHQLVELESKAGISSIKLSDMRMGTGMIT